jgi:hypothetical protein
VPDREYLRSGEGFNEDDEQQWPEHFGADVDEFGVGVE